ncbi:MAG: hypothetical protein ACE5F1_06215 [Planctomycetota bacterium]
MRSYPLFLPALSLLAPAAAPRTQCSGQGDAILEIRSVQNAGNKAGDKLVIRLAGAPKSHVCFLSDLGKGPTRVPGVGTFCLDFGKNLLVVPVFLGASGVIEIPVTIPNGLDGKLVCCQWVGVTAKRAMVISNAICMRVGPSCKRGIHELGLLTSFGSPGPAGARIVAEVRKKKLNGQPIGRTALFWSQQSPPKLPFSSDDIVFIDKIADIGGRLHVLMRVDATRLRKGKLPSNTMFSASAGAATNSEKIHTSCSQPIGTGFVFGKFTITSLR